MDFQHHTFNELTLTQLYDILQLRQDVFVLEQECLYRDIDGLDATSEHVFLYDDSQLVAYSRIYAKQDMMHIGRVIIAKSHRGQSLARQMIQYCIDYLFHDIQAKKIHISAQLRLQQFYESLGFVASSEPFDEDGIMHIQMTKT